MIMELTHFSLCSGIGGLDLAAERAGFRTVAQCEIDEYASKVLAKNFKGVPNLHDIRTVTNERLAECGIDGKEITVISAGFPCQPYSLAGKGLGDRDSRDLWGEVARVLGEIRPPWFVGENTPGLFARQNQRFFRRVLDDLIVYILTNFNTTIEEDLYRVKMVHEAGFSPDIRIYRKAPPRRF